MKKLMTRPAEIFVEFQVHTDTLLGTFALGVTQAPLNFERDSVASLYHRPLTYGYVLPMRPYSLLSGQKFESGAYAVDTAG